MTLITAAAYRGYRRDLRLHDTADPWRLTVDIHVRFTEWSERLDRIENLGQPDQRAVWRDWTDTEMDNFKDNFAQAVQDAWSHKWYLVPRVSERPAACGDDASACSSSPRFVDVTLRVRDLANPAHARVGGNIAVHNVVVSGNPLSDAYEDRGTIHVALGDNQSDLTAGGPHSQVATAHEMGHALGLTHPGDTPTETTCDPGPTPTPRHCYQIAGDGSMIMGEGMRVTRDDYMVFKSLMNAAEWNVAGGGWMSEQRFRYNVDVIPQSQRRL